MRPLLLRSAGLLAVLLALAGCESVNDYNADKFDRIDPASPYRRTAVPFLPNRVGGALVPLADGRALLVGGIVTSLAPGQTLPPNVTELYDPARDAWTTVAPMGRYRTSPTGAAVPDGRVLVVGDDTYSTNIQRQGAEVYTPATNTWTAIGSPTGAAFEQSTAVALPPPGNRVVVGSSIGLVVFDLDAGTAYSVGGLAAARGLGLCVMKDGNVFATYNNAWEVYSPSQRQMIRTGLLRYPRYFAGVATHTTNGRVYICGGGNLPLITGNQAPVRGMEVYDPDSARLLRQRLPTDIERETGYASRGCFTAAGRLLFTGTGGQDALLDLDRGKSLGYTRPGAGSQGPAPTQLSDGRLLFVGSITDLSKYPRP